MRCTNVLRSLQQVRRLLKFLMRFTNLPRIKKNEDVDKGTEKLEDMKEAVVTIRRNASYTFEGQYKGYTGWFNLDSEFLKRKCSSLEPDSHKKLYEKDVEGQDTEQYKTFFVPFYYTKSNLNNINYPVKNRESSSDKDKNQSRKLWHQFVAKSHYLKNI